MRKLWAIGGFLLALAAPLHAHAQTFQSADSGYEACKLPGETDQAFFDRWPSWVKLAVVQIPPGPMQYSVQNVGGVRVLIAGGGIEARESQRLRAALDASGGVAEVWLTSPGGDSREGIRMADVLREYGLITRVPAGYACISACTSAFLGGAMRYVDFGAAYGVHMFTASRSETEVSTTLRTEQRSAMHASDYSQLLVRMGVSLRWADVTFGTRNQCVNYLSRPVMRDLNVINTD